jgi:hypothetical protein
MVLSGCICLYPAEQACKSIAQSGRLRSAVTKQANVQFYPQVQSGPLSRRLATQTASATETSISKLAIARFSTGESSSFLCHCEERSDEAILVEG